MAVFGLPGGAEWLIIAMVLVLLFVPGVLAFWFGYLTGKSAGTRQAASQQDITHQAEEPELPQENADD